MPLNTFLADLFGHGQVRVAVSLRGEAASASRVEDAEARAAVHELLVEAEAVHRLAFAGEPPVFDVSVAETAAAWLHDACVCLANRHLSEEDVAAMLGVWNLEPADAAKHYSADLVLQYLPDVMKLSKGLSEDDPLNGHLQRVGAAWPLSLAGSRGAKLDASRLEIVLTNAALWQMYVDRTLAAGDADRLSDPRCREDAMAALGAQRELAGAAVSKALWPNSPPS